MSFWTRSDVHVTYKQGHFEEVFTQTSLHNLKNNIVKNNITKNNLIKLNYLLYLIAIIRYIIS